MSILGLASTAANSYFDSKRALDKENDDRAFTQQNREEYAARRGSRDLAASLADAQNTASLEQVPELAAVASGRNKATLADQAFTEDRRPGLQELARTADKTAAVKAEDAYHAAQYDHEDLGNQLEQKFASGELQRDAVKNQIYGKLFQVGTAGGAGAASEMAYVLQKYADHTKTLFPELSGKKIGNVAAVDGPDGKQMQVTDPNGQVLMNIPVSRLHQAYKGSLTPKSYITVKPGEKVMLPDASGTGLTEVADNPRTTGANGAHAPAQQQMIELYMKNGRTFDQAVQEVKTSMAKPKAQFILEMVGKTALPGASAAALEAEKTKWANLYDGLHSENAAAPGLSNSAGAPKIDPKIQSLVSSP